MALTGNIRTFAEIKDNYSSRGGGLTLQKGAKFTLKHNGQEPQFEEIIYYINGEERKYLAVRIIKADGGEEAICPLSAFRTKRGSGFLSGGAEKPAEIVVPADNDEESGYVEIAQYLLTNKDKTFIVEGVPYYDYTTRRARNMKIAKLALAPANN